MSSGEVHILILIWVTVIALATFVVVMLYCWHKAKKSSASVQPFNTGLPANQQPGIAHQDPARQMQPAQPKRGRLRTGPPLIVELPRRTRALLLVYVNDEGLVRHREGVAVEQRPGNSARDGVTVEARLVE